MRSISSESAVANGNKAAEKAKPSADEHPVAEDGTVKGKPALDRIYIVRNARNRVVLIEPNGLGAFGWKDRGAGHVACVQSPNQPDEWWMVVRLEFNEKNILESRILTDTIYRHNPQESEIVWLEPDVSRLVLIFQDKAGYTEMWDKICRIQAEGKLRNSEAQLRQTSESNRQLTAELNTSEAKNRETLEKNRNLEQELSNAQIKIQDLEAKFAQTDVAQVIAVMKEKVDKLENGEISRLQKEVAKMSNENEMKSQENSEIRKKLDESEKRNADMNQEKAEMQEELKSWEHFRQLLGGATEYVEGIRKRKAESKDKQSFAQQNTPLSVRKLPSMLEDPEEVELQTKLGSDGNSAKKARIDTQKNLEEAGAKKTANVASGSKAVINS
ncbi:serine/threonine-protein phosphatase 4 regulatory subunit 3 [Ditylenchus destructor]|nr:serine/threonine-protein phosphatase 4 regulatory subunit 3 [Ditylenchus destructor]